MCSSDLSARTAVQRIAFSGGAGNPYYPTHIDLPIYSPGTINSYVKPEATIITELDALVFPNPADDIVSIYMNMDGDYDLTLVNTLGQTIMNTHFYGEVNIDISDLKSGLYFVNIRRKQGSNESSEVTDTVVKKISVR